MNMKYLVVALGISIASVFVFFAFSPKSPEPSLQKLQVVSSFYPLYFFASEVGGDKADVFNITPAGAEPHGYVPTALERARIENAELLIVNGAGLEGWAGKIEKSIDSKKTVTVSAGEGLATQEVVEGDEVITDPHVWLSPVLALQMVDKITAGFVAADQKNATYYTARATDLKEKLKVLDTAYRTGLASCKKRDIVTSHAAFGYMATIYGLRQVPIAGLSPDAEPSFKQMADIALFAKNNNVTVIFFESLVSPKLSETIAKEVGAKTMVLDPIEGLTDDDILAGKNYVTEMERNLANLKTALECTL